MSLAVIIPTRGDRPLFLRHAKYLLSQQTRQPDEVIIIDSPPESNAPDLSRRYKLGLEKSSSEFNILWEDDDWYSHKYLELMYEIYLCNGKPSLMGIGSTVYYHILKREYRKFIHHKRASAMSTGIRRDINLGFIPDNEVFLDIMLWANTDGVVCNFPDTICMGIKHGIGKCGGRAHGEGFKYSHHDPELKYLKSIVDSESFDFYNEVFQNK
jgi:hypothetical protein